MVAPFTAKQHFEAFAGILLNADFTSCPSHAQITQGGWYQVTTAAMFYFYLAPLVLFPHLYISWTHLMYYFFCCLNRISIGRGS